MSSSATSSTSFIQRINTALATGCIEFFLALQRIGSNPQNADGTVEGSSTDSWVTFLHDRAVILAACIGIISSLITFVMGGGVWVVTFLACLTTIVLSPYLVFQKRSLAALGGMRGQQNQMRHHINDLHVTNQQLNQSIDTMEKHAQALEKVEDDLNKIATESGVQKDRLIHVVEETGRLQKLVQKQLQAQVIQQVLTAVITSDSNQDFTLNSSEVQMLKLRLTSLSRVLQLDEAKFSQLQQQGSGDMSLTHIMTLLRNLMDDSLPKENSIFRFATGRPLKQ